MKCPKCGEELEDGMKFCTKCGTNIAEALKEQEELEAKKVAEEAEKKREEEEKEKTQQESEKVEEAEEKNELKEDPKEDEKVEADDKNKVDNKEQVEEKSENKDKKESTENKKENAPKKKSKKKIVIIVLIIILLLAGAGAFGWWYLSNNNTSEEEQVLEWGDVYLQVLNDNEKLEDMDNQKIQLCDLDKDSIPELIIYGIKNASEYIANIYKLNDKNEVDIIRVSLDEEFDLKLVYDASKDDYIWYAVSENEDETKVYNLNIENGEYNSEEITLNFGSDSLEIKDNYSEKIDFDKNASEDEKEEIFNQAVDKYVPTENMITDEVKAEVENIKLLYNVKKVDSSKGIVYTAVSKEIENCLYEYPYINIDSDYAREVNNEIEEEYGFPSSMNSSNYFNHVGPETTEIAYEYTINGDVLSVIIWQGGNESIWADTYTINLSTLGEYTPEDLATKYGFDINDIVDKATDKVTEEFNNMIEQEEKQLSFWDQLYGDEAVEEWEAEIAPYIEEKKLFVNENNELCILGEYRHAGGQWSCTQTVVVNISKEYEVSELEFTTGPIEHYVLNYEEPVEEDEPKTNEEDKKEDEKDNSSGSTVVSEGTYTREGGSTGNIKITNSKEGQFDFDIYCEHMNGSGVPNMGSLQATAKEVSDGVFEYSETKEQNNVADYKITFKVSKGKIVIEESEPYYLAGMNVTFSGTFTK